MADNDDPTTAEEIALALVVRCSSDPIDGTIELPDGRLVQFTGWMQLTQELSRVVDPVG
jgi:hypothetical protein